uniref:PlxyGVORF87 protein n=1 Tax=Plutella xylostella granulovirus TaxID=98383 RepID=A0A1B2CSJ0_9BBAC|nr:PlxyGVORF87 protein [Plutella xylostella granulovirus]
MENLKWNTITNMINMYRNNDTSNLNAEEIAAINLIRDTFIKADPLPVTVTKRFENDNQLIDYYKNLDKKYVNAEVDEARSIFNKTFLISPCMKSYADRFYGRRLSVAAAHLSDVLKFQISDALTRSKPIPSLASDVDSDYVKLLYHETQLPANISNAINDGSNKNLKFVRGVFDKLVEDLLTGRYSGYYLKHCLSTGTLNKAMRFRDNITFLLDAPLTLSTDMYSLIERAAAKRNPERDYSAALDSVVYPQSTLQQMLNYLSFENETLRRDRIQNLNVKYNSI